MPKEEITPGYNCFLEIHENEIFTDEEKAHLQGCITNVRKFIIGNMGIVNTTFRLWADTQEQINAARTTLGRNVIKLLADRIKQ